MEGRRRRQGARDLHRRQRQGRDRDRRDHQDRCLARDHPRQARREPRRRRGGWQEADGEAALLARHPQDRVARRSVGWLGSCGSGQVRTCGAGIGRGALDRGSVRRWRDHGRRGGSADRSGWQAHDLRHAVGRHRRHRRPPRRARGDRQGSRQVRPRPDHHHPGQQPGWSRDRRRQDPRDDVEAHRAPSCDRVDPRGDLRRGLHQPALPRDLLHEGRHPRCDHHVLRHGLDQGRGTAGVAAHGWRCVRGAQPLPRDRRRDGQQRAAAQLRQGRGHRQGHLVRHAAGQVQALRRGAEPHLQRGDRRALEVLAGHRRHARRPARDAPDLEGQRGRLRRGLQDPQGLAAQP